MRRLQLRAAGHGRHFSGGKSDPGEGDRERGEWRGGEVEEGRFRSLNERWNEGNDDNNKVLSDAVK